MMDGDAIKTDGRITVDAPDLGAHVELIEGNVGDALMLMEQASKLPRFEFLLLTLSVSLHIDGKRLTMDQLKALPGHALKTLLRIAPQAVELNQFFEPAAEGEDEPAPKS